MLLFFPPFPLAVSTTAPDDALAQKDSTTTGANGLVTPIPTTEEDAREEIRPTTPVSKSTPPNVVPTEDTSNKGNDQGVCGICVKFTRSLSDRCSCK